MKTIQKKCEIEFEIKKSKFIGNIKPVSTKKEAEEFIAKIIKKYHNASHNCSAYRVIESGKEYYKVYDDGEPSGTAGRPMGEMLNILNIVGVVVVATRYFGGIKLGGGGLIRNYAKVVKLSLEKSNIIDFEIKKKIVIESSYNMTAEIDNILSKEDIKKEYSENVLYRGSVSKNIFIKLKAIRGIILIEQ